VQLLLVLAVLWGAVLIPPWIADRRRDRPVQTMASFHKRLWQLEQLEQAPYASESLGHDELDDVDDDAPGGGGMGAGPGAGVSRAALRRRRQVFFFLLSAVVGSLGALVLLRSTEVLYVHIGSLVLFTGYVTLLVRHHQRATEQVSKVRYLSPIRAPRPAVVVLRSGTAR
jgi:hypothetical protein